MKQKLLSSLTARLYSEVSKKNPVYFLREHLPLDDALNVAISAIYMYTRTKKGSTTSILMTEVICAIGHNIRDLYRLPKSSGLAAKTGAFILYSFESLGLLKVKLGGGTGRHQTYIIEVLNDSAISLLWESLPIEKITKLPSLTPYSDWITARHETGANLVKTLSKEVLTKLTAASHPLVFEAVNKPQHIGWNVNKEIYNIYSWALANKTEAFSDIWEMQNPEARASKVREAVTVGSIAKRLLERTFYHMYSFDFRGRRYCSSAFFHEQGTDLSKGLLLYAKRKSVGKQGFFWLLISLASNWAGTSGRIDRVKTDKLPLAERVYWALDNEPSFIKYANKPKEEQGWMHAEKPWQFLAACIELRNLREYQKTHEDDYGYPSGFVVYIDGSTNGAQHLAALSLDEKTAPLVNLVPQQLPGDLYSHVANHVWLKIERDTNKLTDKQRKELNEVIDRIIEMKAQIRQTEPKSADRAEMIAEMAIYRDLYKNAIKEAAPLYWSRITDSKEKRKIAKRGTMTLAYGSTAYGMSKQVQEDARKHGIPLLLSLEATWASYMGRSLYEDCKLSLERPAQLLAKFEEAGKVAESKNTFLHWTLPITYFPVVQHYTEGAVRKIYVQYGPPIGERLNTGYFENTFQLSVCFVEEPVMSKRKQSLGASPNAIHSLDATHLILTVCAAPFDTTTIHDSFGCALADMSDLFVIVREQFIQLYKADPLTKLLGDMQISKDGLEIGALDISKVEQSEYAFA